jgi:hypothetical protein
MSWIFPNEWRQVNLLFEKLKLLLLEYCYPIHSYRFISQLVKEHPLDLLRYGYQ